MPIKPKPMTYQCPACGWKKTVNPQSDALILGVDGFEECPECGEKGLKTTSADFIDVTLQKIKDF